MRSMVEREPPLFVDPAAPVGTSRRRLFIPLRPGSAGPPLPPGED